MDSQNFNYFLIEKDLYQFHIRIRDLLTHSNNMFLKEYELNLNRHSYFRETVIKWSCKKHFIKRQIMSNAFEIHKSHGFTVHGYSSKY